MWYVPISSSPTTLPLPLPWRPSAPWFDLPWSASSSSFRRYVLCTHARAGLVGRHRPNQFVPHRENNDEHPHLVRLAEDGPPFLSSDDVVANVHLIVWRTPAQPLQGSHDVLARHQ